MIFLLTGKMNNDIQLQDNDVVFISPRQKTVTVKGEARRQSIFELKARRVLYRFRKNFWRVPYPQHIRKEFV